MATPWDHLTESSIMGRLGAGAGGSPGSLPTGTVTFLLSDVAGSTRLWEADEAIAAAAVTRHYELLDAAIALHGGARPLEQGEGDSVVGVFRRASDAAAAALDIQRAFGVEPWPGERPVRVRIALHSGETSLRDERNYFGPTIIRCARVRAAGHGGQILVTAATRDLLAGWEPEGVRLRDLGSHRLKDLGRPERLWQLCHPDLPDQFPALRSLDAVPNNLPVELSSFVGRDREISEVCGAIGEHRLVVLTGAGGCGKTRLAARAVAEVTDDFPDGAWWVELAPVSEPGLAAYAAASALGFHEEEGRPMLDTLCEQLSGLNALVVLDNCEHVLDDAARLADTLLQSATGLRIVATSREPLGVRGELTWRIPSLDADTAARLFVERAAQARAGFVPDSSTMEVIREICARLDGIPLAIELAASRTRMMSPERIAAGLGDRFRLLTGGGRTALPRQQTLLTSIAWSYDLLDETEQVLLQRLSVFAGGFSLEAAEEVCAADPIGHYAVLDLLGRLIDKSLVQVGAGDTDRYRLLETIRMYAQDRLVDSGETNAVRDQHRDFFLTLAETAAPELTLADGPAWLGRLDDDLDNLRAALEWADASAAPELFFRMVSALTLFFELRGHLGEGGRWFARALAVDGQPSAARARALWGSAHLAGYAGDFPTAAARAPEALAMAEAVGDEQARARALNTIGFLQMWPDPAQARATFAESIQLGRQIGDHWAVADGLKMTTVAWLSQDDYEGLKPSLDELLRVAEEMGNRFFTAWCHCSAGWVAVRRGDLDAARTELALSLEQCQEVGEPVTAGIALAFLGEIAALTRDDATSGDRLDAFLQRANATGGAIAIPWAVTARANLALVGGDATSALAIVDPLLAEMRSLGLPMFLSSALVVHAIASLGLGDDTTAETDLRQARDTATTIDNRWLVALADHHLGVIARRRDQPDRAQNLLHDALALRAANKWLPAVAETLSELAAVAVDQESYLEATRLLGAASALRMATGCSPSPEQRSNDESLVGRIHGELDDAAFVGAWSEGEALSADEAVAYVSRARGERNRPSSGWASLTPTEANVVGLVAEGLTNPQIAERLFIARGTVKAHLAHIFTKLHVSTRAELAAQATMRKVEST
jgi:predicted ATPase/class 3 adenylate cyclase/DNA-binding CsgD family transcriptional regulator